MTLQHARLFGGEAKRRALLIKHIDPREERVVQMNLGIMPRHQWRDIALNRLQSVIRIGVGQIEEDGGDLPQTAAGTFKRGDRIVEARRRGIVRNGRDLRSVLREGIGKGRRVMLRHDR